jgi:hypothetical protein
LRERYPEKDWKRERRNQAKLPRKLIGDMPEKIIITEAMLRGNFDLTGGHNG